MLIQPVFKNEIGLLGELVSLLLILLLLEHVSLLVKLDFVLKDLLHVIKM